MAEDQQGESLHLVMFPWFAIGHLRPFFRLAKVLARKGHRISFISSPRNLQRIPKVPADVSHLIDLVSIPLPRLPDLPHDGESSMDVPHVKQQLLKVALDLLEPSIREFLEAARPKPDWIIYDYASHWLPRLAQELGISRAFLSLFTAAFMAFLGPPSAGMGQLGGRLTAEDFTVAPKWIPFQTNMAYRLHEMTKNLEKDSGGGNEYDSGASDIIRFSTSLEGSDLVIFRSCVEFEPEWFELVGQLYQKPVIPVGVLPVEDEEGEDQSNNDWLEVKDWLDKQKKESVVYVAFGTETILSPAEVQELALGLEHCGLPFFWVLNKDENVKMLPDGFCKRVEKKGKVYAKWAPQTDILSHPAVGGFLTHCGWNSVTEALCYGRVLILFPVMNDQGMNARLLTEKKVGVEISRNERDGSFMYHQVAEALRLAIIGEEGRSLRENAQKMKQLLTDKCRNERHIGSLLHHLARRGGNEQRRSFI